MPSPTEMLSEIQSTLQTLPERMGNVLSDQQLPAPSYEVNPSVTPASQAGNAGRASGGSMTPDMPATFPNLPPASTPSQMARTTTAMPSTMPSQSPAALPTSATLPSVDMQEVRASGIGGAGASVGPAGIFGNVLAQSERAEGEDPARKMIDLLEEIVEGIDKLNEGSQQHGGSNWGQKGTMTGHASEGWKPESLPRNLGLASPSFRRSREEE